MPRRHRHLEDPHEVLFLPSPQRAAAEKVQCRSDRLVKGAVNKNEVFKRTYVDVVFFLSHAVFVFFKSCRTAGRGKHERGPAGKLG